MIFATPARKTTSVSIRLPDDLLARIDADAEHFKQSRTDRLTYLLEYAYQAGSLNSFIDTMAAQYAQAIAAAQGLPPNAALENLANEVDTLSTMVSIQNRAIERVADHLGVEND